MLGRTHFVFGIFLGLWLFEKFESNIYLFLLIISLTALVPDLDNPNSKYGRKVKLFSGMFNFLFGHRTITHSLFVAAGLSLLIWNFFGNYWIPFFLGYFSHLILDGVTKQGVNFIYPLKEFRLKGFIKTGGLLENVFFFLVVIGVGYLTYFKLF